MRLLPSDTPLPKRLLRNGRTITLEVVLFLLWTLLLPLAPSSSGHHRRTSRTASAA